jgi:tetratricopeptide (TPR) repeat protein
VILTIAPVTLRNYVRSGEFVPICTIGGLNLYAGNNPDATGSFPVLDYRELFGINETLSHHNFPQLLLALERKTGQEDLGYADLEQYFVDSALDYMKSNPINTLGLMVRKTFLYWGPWEVSSNKVLYYDKQDSPVLRFLPGFPFVAGLFFSGAIMWLSRRRRGASDEESAAGFGRSLLYLLLLFVGVSFATHLLFFVVGRFRVPVIPFMLLFGAYGCFELYRYGVARNWKALGVWGGATFALVVFFHIPLVSYAYDLPLWHLQRGTAYGEKGQIEPAIKELETAIHVGGTAPWFFSDLGFAYFHKGDYLRAVELYEKALAVDPGWTDAQHKLGLAKFRLEEYEEALAAFDAAIAGNFTATAPRLDRVLTLTQLGRYDEAEEEMAQLRELGADLRDFSFRLGYIAASEGRSDEAIAHFRLAIEENPENGAAYNYLGFELAKKGDLEAAEEHYRKAIEVSPNYPAAYVNLGNLYAHRELYDEAIIFYGSALNAQPGNADAFYGLGYTYFQLEDYQEATIYFTATIEREPEHANAHNYLGLSMLQTNAPLGRITAAFRNAIAADPSLILARNNLGDAYRKAGVLERALEVFEETLERWPDNTYARTQAEEIRHDITTTRLQRRGEKPVVVLPGGN